MLWLMGAVAATSAATSESSTCGDQQRPNTCASHGIEVQCFQRALSADDLSYLRRVFNQVDEDGPLISCEELCSNPCDELNGPSDYECGACTAAHPWAKCRPGPPRPVQFGENMRAVSLSSASSTCDATSDSCGEADLELSADFYMEGVDHPQEAAGKRIRRRTVPRNHTPRLEEIAQKLTHLAARANELSSWGFSKLDATAEEQGKMRSEGMSHVTYLPGGWCPIHRDVFLSEQGETIEVADALEAEALPWTQAVGHEVGLRRISVIVQLSDRGVDYGGGALQMRLGTAAEPALAQRKEGGFIVDAIRQSSTVIDAPACAGDVVIFTGMVVHGVQPILWGSRESLIWWVPGEPPSSGVWDVAFRSPWNTTLFPPETKERLEREWQLTIQA